MLIEIEEFEKMKEDKIEKAKEEVELKFALKYAEDQLELRGRHLNEIADMMKSVDPEDVNLQTDL